jgi:phytoene synthase
MKGLSPLAALLRRHDRDRYLTALFAPADRRAALLALYAFNYEIAKIRETVSEPILGRIRLQWWRENLDAAFGARPERHHEVMTPLSEAIARFNLSRAHFERLLDARELDLVPEPPADLAALEAYCEGTSSRILWIALEILDLGEDRAAAAAAREIGVAYAIAGLLRAVPFHARAKRLYIPSDVIASAGVDVASLFELKGSPSLADAAARMTATARRHLAEARGLAPEVPARALPALLPARIATAALDRLERANYDVFDPALAGAQAGTSLNLAWAALRRRY